MRWDFKPVAAYVHILYAFTTAAFTGAKQASAAILLLSGTKASKYTRKALPHCEPSTIPCSGPENSHIDI